MDTTNAQDTVINPDEPDILLNEIKNLQSNIMGLETNLHQIDPRQMVMQEQQQSKQRLIGELHQKQQQLLEKQGKLNEIFINSHRNYISSHKDFEANKSELERITNLVISSAEAARELSDNATKVAQDALETATTSAGIAAAKPLIEHFRKRTDELFWPFWIWLALTIAFFFSTVYFITHVNKYLDAPNPNNGTEVALFISSKIIIVSLLVSAMIWCGKLFGDSYTKRGFYKHKIAITKTYKVFMESTQEAEVKDAILKESLKHIFSAPPSSYDSNKTEIEVIKSVPSLVHAMTGEK